MSKIILAIVLTIIILVVGYIVSTGLGEPILMMVFGLISAVICMVLSLSK